jgi:nucleoside-diphosphate-sugar epimerase
MKIAILGARGFLGSYLTDYFLQRNYDVIPVTRETVNLESYYDVDYWLSKDQPDVIVNCAISSGSTRVNDINYSDVQRDLTIFLNFYNNSRVKKYINIGSGAEFDRRNSIVNAIEEEILFSHPLESYGFTKNAIARMCLGKENFYTLRLFGCFDKSEHDTRLFKKFLADTSLPIENKFFDYISASDFAKVVEAYCQPHEFPKDINCVYVDKYKLSSILMRLKPGVVLNINKQSDNAYTGLGARLAALPIQLDGLEKGLSEYE